MTKYILILNDDKYVYVYISYILYILYIEAGNWGADQLGPFVNPFTDPTVGWAGEPDYFGCASRSYFPNIYIFVIVQNKNILRRGLQGFLMWL